MEKQVNGQLKNVKQIKSKELIVNLKQDINIQILNGNGIKILQQKVIIQVEKQVLI